MSIHISSAVWKRKGLDPLTKLVLLKLADNANDEGECWPSIRRIVDETGLARSTVFRRLEDLEELKLIERHRRETTSARNITTLYWISLDEILKTSVPDGVRPPDYSTFDKQPSVARTGPQDGPNGPQDGPKSPGPGLQIVSRRHPNHKGIVIEPSFDPSRPNSLTGAGILLESEMALPVEDLAETIYKAYPRHIAKKEALRAIRSAFKRGMKPPDLLAATKRYTAAVLASDTKPEFVPYPATWYNADRWNDPLPAPANGVHSADALTTEQKQIF